MANSIPPLVSAEWLHHQLTTGDPHLVLLDVTWCPDAEAFPYKSAKEVFEKKHLPAAILFDLNACVEKTQYRPRNQPQPKAFETYLRSLGLKQSSKIVLYDRDDGQVFTTGASGRTWFQLKSYGIRCVAVLNGGLVLWEKKGYDTESGPSSSIKGGDIAVQLDTNSFVDYDQMKEIEKTGSHQIVDSRLAINFNGEEEEPCPFISLVLEDAKANVPTHMRRGHMKDAKNIPFMEFFNEDMSFISVEKLNKILEKKGIHLSMPLVATCYIGHTAAIVAFLLHLCGKTDTRVYNGSWVEYGQRESC